ncbi:AAA family ATPase [Thermoleophilia bacterium SCSIO 60948]|nr:AAA family ATPase [Thermoleophilia bacterium SCSIO 60948]
MARMASAGFIGRAEELGELDAGLDAAERGEAGVTVLAGDSGVGKTRLIGEVERRAAERGFRVLEGECVDLGSDQLPYAPLAAALRPLVRSADPVLGELPDSARAELAAIAPGLAGGTRPGPGDGQAAQLRLFEAVLTLLSRIGEQQPVLLVIEDTHWADRSTRGFAVFLSRALRDERVHAILSLRSDELGRRHPLRPALAQIERAQLTRRIDLRPFDREELAAQVVAIGGAEPRPHVLDALFARSEGNALFAEELIASGAEAGGPLPSTLRDAMLLRFESLSPRARAAIDMLAIAGSADDELLALATGIDVEVLRDGLREGLEANVLTRDSENRIGFRHALLREVVLDELLPGERSESHLALARALEATEPGDVASCTSIAHHFHAAGAQREAFTSSLEAARLAEEVAAFGEAGSLYERALSLWPRIDDAESLAGADLAELELRAHRSFYGAGEDSRSLPLLRQAIDRLDPETDRMRLAIALGELAYTLWARGHAEESRANLDRALDLAGPEPGPVRARLLSYRLRQHLLQGRLRHAIEIGDEALRTAEASGENSLRPFILARLGSALFAVGRFNEGRAAFEEAQELGAADPLLEGVAAAYANYADSLMLAGRTREAVEVIEAGHTALAHASRGFRWIGIVRSEMLFGAGRWDEAEAALPKTYGTDGVAWLLRRAEMALGRGDEPRAAEALAEARERLADALEPQYLATQVILSVDLEVHRRDHAAARALIEEGLDRIEYCSEDIARLGQVAAAGVSVEAGAARHARDVGDADAERRAREGADRFMARVEAAADDAVSPLEAAVAAHARADHARAHARADEAELRRLAAERWRDLERPYEEATTLWKAAEAALDRGERGAAARDASRALEIARGLGSRWLVDETEGLIARGRLSAPAEAANGSAAPDERPFGLTAREAQVLERVARGETNREIASELYMAEKTASVHVSRILSKLGVRSRTEAAAVAHRQGLTG